MKTIATLSLVATLSMSGVALAAEPGDNKGMDMKGMHSTMDRQPQAASRTAATHKATATVTAVDRGQGTVTLAHGPVPSLKWPAMTMRFAVKDKSLFDKLSVGKKVDVELVQQGSGYEVSAVK
jgi:Cu(I)/Ag(I) efflux system protein CusF